MWGMGSGVRLRAELSNDYRMFLALKDGSRRM